MNPQLQQLVRSELNPEEKVLWSGHPDAKRAAIAMLPIYLFAIPWTAFSLSFMVRWHSRSGFDSGLDIGSLIFQSPFILIGVGILCSPLWVYAKSQRTVYAITDKRVLIIEGGRSKTVQSYDETSVGDIQRVERVDGSGDLTFAQKYSKDSDGDVRKTDIKFVGIPEVRRVEEIIRGTFRPGKA